MEKEKGRRGGGGERRECGENEEKRQCRFSAVHKAQRYELTLRWQLKLQLPDPSILYWKSFAIVSSINGEAI